MRVQMIGRCESCERMALLFVTVPDWSGESFLVCRTCAESEENEE
jgi:hypothetical protein